MNQQSTEVLQQLGRSITNQFGPFWRLVLSNRGESYLVVFDRGGLVLYNTYSSDFSPLLEPILKALQHHSMPSTVYLTCNEVISGFYGFEEVVDHANNAPLEVYHG